MKHVRRICAVLLAVVVLLPIVLLCVQAFVPPFDALMISTGSEPLRLLPIPFSAEQWQMLFNQSTYWQAFWNSLIWTVGACAVQVMVAFLGGYVLAKYPARWCVAIAGLYTLMMLMPPQMTLLPIYRVAYANKLLNHPMLLYAPIAFAPFGTFFMRQWLLRWPDELTEYLRLEGGSSVKLLWYCLAPYSLPGMLALFALTFTEGVESGGAAADAGVGFAAATAVRLAERLVSGKPTDCVCRVRRVNFADCAGDAGSAGAAGKQAESSLIACCAENFASAETDAFWQM